jgi:hypothetical protein
VLGHELVDELIERLDAIGGGAAVEDRPGALGEQRARGKIQERCCHGLTASSDSHRQTVTPEMCSTIPRVIDSRASSEEDQRESGTSLSTGSEQAIAITSART